MCFSIMMLLCIFFTLLRKVEIKILRKKKMCRIKCSKLLTWEIIQVSLGKYLFSSLSFVESSNDSEITFCFQLIHVKHRTLDEALTEEGYVFGKQWQWHDIRSFLFLTHLLFSGFFNLPLLLFTWRHLCIIAKQAKKIKNKSLIEDLLKLWN